MSDDLGLLTYNVMMAEDRRKRRKLRQLLASQQPQTNNNSALSEIDQDDDDDDVIADDALLDYGRWRLGIKLEEEEEENDDFNEDDIVFVDDDDYILIHPDTNKPIQRISTTSVIQIDDNERRTPMVEGPTTIPTLPDPIRSDPTQPVSGAGVDGPIVGPEIGGRSRE
uniref:Uncharacterized protein n=1 Tax=Cannabis sativa TaxID=3483 RepID=A0A803R6M4_CANSA